MFKTIEPLINNFEGSCYLYWIRLEEHDDILTQGYVGFTKNYTKRVADHKSSYKCYKNTGDTHHRSLHKAVDKYESQTIIDVVYVGDRDSALYMEELLRPRTYIGWNMNKGGDYGWVGREHTEESISKMRQSKLGLKQSPETIRKRMESRSGYSPSQETRDKSGKAISEWYASQTKEHRSEIAKKSACKRIANGNHIPSDAARKKRSDSLKGRIVTQETINLTNFTKKAKRDLDTISCVINHGRHRYIYEVCGQYVLTADEGAFMLGLETPQSFRSRCKSNSYEECRLVHKDTQEYHEALDYLYKKQAGEA